MPSRRGEDLDRLRPGKPPPLAPSTGPVVLGLQLGSFDPGGLPGLSLKGGQLPVVRAAQRFRGEAVRRPCKGRPSPSFRGRPGAANTRITPGSPSVRPRADQPTCTPPCGGSTSRTACLGASMLNLWRPVAQISRLRPSKGPSGAMVRPRKRRRSAVLHSPAAGWGKKKSSGERRCPAPKASILQTGEPLHRPAKACARSAVGPAPAKHSQLRLPRGGARFAPPCPPLVRG